MSINTSLHLSSIFDQIGQETNGQRGMLVKDKNGYQVVHLNKETLHFLTFDEVIYLVDSFKKELETNPIRARKISDELKAMTKRKMEKEAEQNVFIRFILQIVQRIKNFLGNRGFLTSSGYAKGLIKHLDNLTFSPSTVDQSPAAPNPGIRLPTPIKRQSTIGKSTAIQAFRKDPSACTPFHKTILFRDIDSYRSLCELIHEIAEANQADFNNPLSRVVILEALKWVRKETSDQIIEQITQLKSFNHLLFCEILHLIIEKSREQKAFSLYSLELLLKTYMRKKWHLGKLSLEDETLLQGILLLIKSKPNENPTTQFIDWMIEGNKLSSRGCAACIEAYREKIREKPLFEQSNIVYPNLRSLENYLANPL